MPFRFLAHATACLIAFAGFSFAQDNPFGGFKHDSTQPIEITADSLEVRQAENQAVFSGEVVAGQGTLRLTADRLVVSYSTEGSSDASTGAIQNVRAEGNVFLSNGSETAQGDWAEYNVVAGTINMGGKRVVLTQGGNALAGQRLFVDLNSGVGRMEGRTTATFAPAAQGN